MPFRFSASSANIVSSSGGGVMLFLSDHLLSTFFLIAFYRQQVDILCIRAQGEHAVVQVMMLHIIFYFCNTGQVKPSNTPSTWPCLGSCIVRVCCEQCWCDSNRRCWLQFCEESRWGTA